MGISRKVYSELLSKRYGIHNLVKSKIQKPRRKNNNQEYLLQCALVLWLESLHIPFCANAGAGVKLTMGQAVKVKRMGYRAGFPDIQIIRASKDYHGMFIELKCGKTSYPSDHQKAWQELLTKEGYYAVIMPPLPYIDALNWVKREIMGYLNLHSCPKV